MLNGRILVKFLEWRIGVSLNVKDPEAHRLAQAIARETGESLTKVVIESLRARHERLQKRKGKASLDELMSIAKRASRAVRRPYVDHGELLYDRYGLPK
jgi:antitoxin VapB